MIVRLVLSLLVIYIYMFLYLIGDIFVNLKFYDRLRFYWYVLYMLLCYIEY